MAISKLDQSRFPIVVLRVAGEPTHQENADLLQLIEQLLDNSPEPIYLLCDLSQASMPDAAIRKATSLWLQDNEALVKEKVQEFIFVYQSTLMMLKAIFTLSPLPAPSYTSTSMEQGLLWARQRTAQIAS